MIRVALECVLVFLLPAAVYFGYVVLMVDLPDAVPGTANKWMGHLDNAPLAWLFALGVLFLFGALLTFATLEDDGIDQPYAPAIFKDGQIQKGTGK